MTYWMIGSDNGGMCNFIGSDDCPIGYSDGQPFISAINMGYPILTDSSKESQFSSKEVNK